MAKKSAIDLRNEYNKSKHNKASDSTYSTFEKTQSILGDSKSYMDTQSQYRQDVANNQIAYNNEMYRRKKELAEQQIFNDALDMIRSKRSWYKPADMEQANKDLYGSNDPNSAYSQAKNVYAGYTTKEAAQNAQKASSAASKNLEQAAKIYATYNDPVAKAYSKNLYNAADNYDQVSKDMGNAADIYGYYKTEDAYNAAVREQELKDKYAGLSFEDIQKEKAKLDPSSDEYKFLEDYGVKQGYQSESDYDKDIASRAVTEDDKVYATWNKLSDSYSYDDVKRIIDANNNNDLDSLWDDFDEDQVGEVISAYQFQGMDVEEQAFHDAKDLERAKNQYHQEHTFDRYYNSVVANSDFPIMSQYGYNPLSNTRIEASSDKKYSDDLSSGEDDLKKVYEYMNTNPEKIDELWTFGFAADYKEKGYAFASKEEREVFNYLYNSRDLDKAKAYLEEMEPTWTKRREMYGDSVLSDYYDDANVAEKIALNIGSSGLNIVGGIQSGANMLDSIVSGKDYNPYAALSEASRLSSGIRKETGEEIAKNTSWEVAGRNVGQFAYNTIASTLDSATGVVLLGPSYAVVASGNVFNQTAEQMIGKGYSQDEIWLTAGSAAVAEALFEKYSIDKLVSIPKSTGWKNILKSAFKQGGIEASEEVFTEMSNLITDTLFRGGTSELSEMYDEYIKRGFSEEEAKNAIQKEIIARITEAGLGGFFSGGIMGGFQSATGAYQNKKVGENISSESMDKMAERASDIENLSKDGKNIVNKHQSNPEEVTDAEKGALYDELYNLDHEIVKEVTDEINDTADKKNGRVVSYEESEDAVDINDISDIKLSDSGKISLYSKSESNWMKASDIKVNSMDASTIANMAAVFAKTDETKAKTFIANYSDKISAQDYVKVFNKLMNSAIQGYTLTEALESDKTLDMLSKKMTDEEIANIFMYAKNVEQGIIDKSTSAEQVSIVQNIADKAGINLVFDDDIKNANGFYRDSDGTIHLSKRSINPLTVVFSHEFVHYLAANDSENFNRLKAVGSDYLMRADPEKYKEIINEKSSIYAKEIVEWKKAGLNIADKLNEEITAHMTEAVMQDITSKSEKEMRRFTDSLYEENPGIVQKIKDFIHDMLTKVKNALAGYKATSTEAKELLKNKEQLELFEKCLIESMTKKETGDIETKTNIAKTSNLVSEELMDKWDEDFIDGTNVTKEGDSFTDNSAMMNLKSYDEGGREKLQSWLQDKSGLTTEEQKDIMDQIESAYKISTELAEKEDLVDFSSWSQADIMYRKDGTPVMSVVVPNGDYPLNIDFSSICKKRKALDKVLNALVKGGKLNEYTLSQKNINTINRVIKEHGFEIACGLCFVDSKRYRQGAWAESFTTNNNKTGWNDLVASLVKKGSNIQIDEFNFSGRNVENKTENLLKDANDEDLSFDYINSVLAKYNSGTEAFRFARAIKDNKNLRSFVNKSELMSSAGLDGIKAQNDMLYDLVNSHQGSAKPKLSHSEKAYGNEILLDDEFNPEDAYMVGGVRVQSFSDYMANMFFDYQQMFSDLAAKSLPSHAYTKEEAFARLFGLNGTKINLSVVPKGADISKAESERFTKMTKDEKEKDAEFKRLKSHAGLDENGNYIIEDETFDFEKAKEISSMDGYDKNVGIIMVGVSDAHIDKLLADPQIHMVIPYHKSSINPVVARLRNIDFYNDYTKQQNTRYDSASKKKVPSKLITFDFYEDLAKTNDPKQTAKNYVEYCRANDFIPKFDKWADNENYYKLLIDFRVYDNEGNYAKQGPVTAKLPDNFAEIVSESLQVAQETEDRFSKDQQDLLDEVIQEIEKDKSEGKMMSIKSTTDGRSVAVIDDDILDGVAEADYIKEVKKIFQGIHIVKTKYSSFSMNARDKREYLNAKYSMYLARNEQDKFYDKLRAAKYVGDIFVAASDYVDEESKHKNYNSFGRGYVLLQIGNNQYSAEVVIGVTKSGVMHFYDIVNIKKEQFTIKNPDRATSSTNSARVRSDLDSKNIVSNDSGNVNNYNIVDKSIKNANTNEETAYDYFTDAYITNGSGLLRKGFEIIKKNGFKIEPGEVSDIVSKMISDEESKISQEAFEQRVTALFNYMRSQKQLTSKDIMKITSEITADLIKKSKTFEGSDEELYSRSYEAALRLYQYYFSTRNRKISNKIEDVTQNLRDSFNERMKKAGANRALTEIKKQIYTKKQTLDRMLTNPTKGSHVPAHLVKTAVAFAEAVNTERSKMGYKANEQAKKVREAYQNLKNDETFSNFQYDEELEEYLKTVESIFENKNVANLTIEEANMVNKVLKALIVQIRNYNRLVSSKRAEDLKEASSGAIIEMVNVKAYDPTKTLSRLSNWYQSEALNFERLMKRTFGYTKNSWGQKMVDILKGAEIESLKDVREAEAIFHDVLSGNTQEERKENRKKVLEFTGKNEKGKYDMETWVTLPYSEEKVPRSVRMSMLMNLLNMDNARHAAYGGFTIPDTVELLRGNYVEAYDKGHYYRPAFFSEDFLEETKKYANQFEYYDMELGKIVVNKNNPYLKEYKRKITQYENLNKTKVYKLHESKINKLKEELQNQKEKNKRAEIGKELNQLYQDIDEEYKARKRYLKESASKAWDEYQKAYSDAMNAIEDKIKRSAEEYVSEIKKDMNEYEKEFLSKAQEFFYEFSSDKINEVSMNLYGYKKASVKNYYPIKVDSDTIATDSPSIKFDGTLEGSGILKKRVISRKPILMEDITQTVQRHIKQVSNFHGYAEAVRDVKGILNYTDNQKYMSLRKMIRQKWGDAVMKQIDQVIADIESPRTNRSWITKKMSDMRSMFAGATLTGNIGVMLKQAASYPTAAAEVGWKSLQKALKNSGKTGIKEVEERTPLLYYRESGYSTQELGDLKNMKVSENKFKFFTGMITWMDIRTVRKLEYAAMYYVDDNTNLEKGSDEYWDAVTEKFNDIVRRTQPNYTMLERPELLRDPDSLLRTLFMFKTQPLQNYGILYDAVNEYKALKKMNAKKEDMDAAKTQLARAVTSNLAAQAVFSLITILVNLMYHKPDDYIDEETKEFDWGKFGFRFVSGIANAEAGMLAFGSEMYSYIESRIFGTKYYGVSDSVVDQINNITDGMSNFFDSLEKISDAKTEAKKEEAVKKTLYRGRVMATAIGQLFGIPVNNIYKPINSMVAYTQDIINGEIWSGKGILPYNPDVESQYDRIIDSIIEDDLDRFDKLKNELIDASEASDPEKTTSDGIKNKAIKKAYISGQIDEEKAKKYLLLLGYDEEKANNYIADFIAAKYSDSIDDMIGASGSLDINSQVKEKVKESVKAGEMTEKEAIDYLVKAGYDKNEAYFEVQKIEYDKMYGHLLSEISSQAKSGKANQKTLNDIVKEYTEHGKDKSDVASAITSNFKPIYLESKGAEKTNLYAILLKAYQSCGLTRKEAEDRIKKWKK